MIEETKSVAGVESVEAGKESPKKGYQPPTLINIDVSQTCAAYNGGGNDGTFFS